MGQLKIAPVRFLTSQIRGNPYPTGLGLPRLDRACQKMVQFSRSISIDRRACKSAAVGIPHVLFVYTLSTMGVGSLLVTVAVGLLGALLGAGWVALPDLVGRVLEMEHLQK